MEQSKIMKQFIELLATLDEEDVKELYEELLAEVETRRAIDEAFDEVFDEVVDKALDEAETKGLDEVERDTLVNARIDEMYTKFDNKEWEEIDVKVNKKLGL